MTADACELVEVVARLGDTILEVKLVAAGSTVFLGETALVAMPGIERVGLVDVTISAVTRPVRELPYATNGDRRTLPYLAMSIAAHVLICGIAITTPPGSGTEVGFTDRAGAPRIGWRTGGAAGAAGAAATSVGMALEEIGPDEPKRDPDRAIAAAQTPGMTDNNNDARAFSLSPGRFRHSRNSSKSGCASFSYRCAAARPIATCQSSASGLFASANE